MLWYLVLYLLILVSTTLVIIRDLLWSCLTWSVHVLTHSTRSGSCLFILLQSDECWCPPNWLIILTVCMFVFKWVLICCFWFWSETGWGTNEKLIISILAHRNAAQRSLIRSVYAATYNEDLLKALDKELSSDFEVLTLAIFLGLWSNLVNWSIRGGCETVFVVLL